MHGSGAKHSRHNPEHQIPWHSLCNWDGQKPNQAAIHAVVYERPGVAVATYGRERSELDERVDWSQGINRSSASDGRYNWSIHDGERDPEDWCD